MNGFDGKLIRNAILGALLSASLCLPQALLAGDDHDTRSKGRYMAGDFHNHDTFSDGSTSIQRLAFEAVDTYGLDWYANSGHGGPWARNGQYDDFKYDCEADGQGYSWEGTPGGVTLKGDPAGTGYCSKLNMWRWQSLQEYAYPKMIEKYQQYQKPIWLAYEYQVPGHEHCSLGNIAGQFKGKGGNADALAQFEYLFDMEDNDMSGGDGQGWSGKIPNPQKTGTDVGIAGHAKAVKSVEWLQNYYPKDSYAVWAHVERKGAWSKDLGGNNTGFNVEHFRDFNNAGPDVAFGFEGQPGHQASQSRGGFGSGAFGGTRGGTGKYSAEVGGLWDALLGEGRNWWLFASSDWHSRGDFSPYDLATKDDFWPGEFQKDYLWIDKKYPEARDVIDAMRGGNSFTTMGDLIDDLRFTISANDRRDVTMGETLRVRKGSAVRVKVRLHDPAGSNKCPYAFDNPSLAQVSISQPLNQPELDNVQLICGDVTGRIQPSSKDYTKATNDNMWPVEVIRKSDMIDEGDGWYSFERALPADGNFYCRLRGTNLPPGTPNETYGLDTTAPEGPGGPMLDSEAKKINCADCPPHTNGIVDYDVEAWSDLWFYSNPVFVTVLGR